MDAAADTAATEEPAWTGLAAELDAWTAAGRTARLFWRDDDATRAGAALDRLFAVTAAAGAPLLLAVIPARAEDALAQAVAAAGHVRPAVHGWAHVNHARGSGDRGAWELGLHRGADAVLADLGRGGARLAALFGDRALRVIVPPWNRIDERLFAALAESGWCGVSAFGPRAAARPAAGLTVNNAHVDPIRWKDGAAFAGAGKTLALLVGHLAARRTGAADPDEATGLLTHHADLDEAGWKFVERLGAAIRRHPAACWCDPADLFAGA
jgi:hypothetical protein